MALEKISGVKCIEEVGWRNGGLGHRRATLGDLGPRLSGLPRNDGADESEAAERREPEQDAELVATSPRLRAACLPMRDGDTSAACRGAGGDQPELEAVGGITGDTEEEELATHGGLLVAAECRWWGGCANPELMKILPVAHKPHLARTTQ